MTLLSDITVSFPTSAFAPLAVGFFGLGTGYLVYGPQELLNLPERTRSVDITTGLWGIWMAGFMQFLAGVYLWVGLAWFHTFRASVLYMAALAFTAYGVHWFSLGMARALHSDPRPNEFMAIAYTLLSVLGIIVFFNASDWVVGLVFVGLTAVYISEFFATLFVRHPTLQPQHAGAPGGEASGTKPPPGGPSPQDGSGLEEVNALAERSLGFFRLLTGTWLMYVTYAVTLDLTSGMHLPT